MKKHYVLFFATILIFSACKKDDNENYVDKNSITGFVQKGPFINGTSVSVNELNANLSQTGKVFNSQITDNNGSFEVSNIGLISSYVCLKADGFYYNEIQGKVSSAQITLYALSDISNKSTINVNLLSHLEKPRIEYLVSQGESFSNAKIQALSEILQIFNIQKPDIACSELLDISQSGEDNAILLAISSILQGYRTESELTALLSDISTDIKEDGTLDDTTLCSELINQAVYLDTAEIKTNLQNRYTDLGVSFTISNFKEYIQNFIDSTSYEISEPLIEYPPTGLYGDNLLDLSKTEYTGNAFSMAVNIPEGTTLKIKLTLIEGSMFPTPWGISTSSNINWLYTTFDNISESQVFTVVEAGQDSDIKINNLDVSKLLVEYFEMGSEEPIRTKTIMFTSK